MFSVFYDMDPQVSVTLLDTLFTYYCISFLQCIAENLSVLINKLPVMEDF